MDFVVGLPLTARKKDSIWVIVDRLTKTAHFIAMHTTYSVQDYVELYVDQIVHLHRIPRPLFLINVLNLWLVSGNNCMNPWKPN
jgi:hypothetical protein